MNMATGKWMPRTARNRVIVARLREACKRVHTQRPGEVRVRHVRSHTKLPGNELADKLAAMGAQGARQATGRPAIALAAAWLRGWLQAERGEGGGPRARLDTLGDPRGEG